MKSTILIVDDEEAGRDTIEAMLEGHGYHLELAASGPQALEKAAALTPDLVLLDIMMPGMDGFEVCRQMRSMPRLAEVPIVILTALDEPFFMLQGIEAGADDFITKPVDRKELNARVQTILRLNRYRTLLEQRENLRLLSSRLVAAQEQERQRISRELHDDLGQVLTAQMLSLHNLKEELPLPVHALRERLDGLFAETSEILDRVRALAHDLRPPLLETMGLQQAIDIHCRDFSQRTHIPVELKTEAALFPLSDLYSITLYRILQEALTNVARHARARRVWVDLVREEDEIHLTVQDNGCGFNVNGPQADGLGLVGIQERLLLVGGKLVLRSRPDHGTVLSARLPVDDGSLGISVTQEG